MMAPMTANPADDRARSRDLARLDKLTGPHLPYRGAPIQQALVHMTPYDRAEVIAILGRIGDPREGATDDDVT
jgi:hypothetical protein